ncbi:MAG: zinc metalloprotease HtpX [Methanothrix sp.]|jgi:heat shock protein HtpX|nr:MAG: heat-shock protein HtpX [Methanosaeta sp. SDB]MCP1392370.1 zinc metalloprotease HtpX [Methanothrix harundinacea]MDD2637556.1 zinc metalloprotease HtpX [Methanothrix sp.]MDI9398115.1 zinc metalloprotease HtpX [Euryarchaeota archaeon]MDD3709562.1 zinc metalloprotease HtpX [Methanothrix sp.]
MKRKWQRDRGLEARMLFTMFLLGIVYLAFLAILAYQGTGLVGMLAFVSVFMLIQYFFSDKLVLKSMGAKIVSESEEPELHQMISRLCAMADLPKPRIAVVKTPMPNAFATGRSPRNAVVAVTTGIRSQLTAAELEAVLAHELTHVKNRDVMVMTIASFLSTVAFFIVRYSFFFGGGGSSRDKGGVWAAFFASVVVWIVSSLLIRALSRYREYAADRGSAVITGQPSNLASALMKISGVMPRIPKEDLRKAEGMNAFFIIPAISGSSIMNLLSTHPPTEKRIAALQKIERELEMA